MIRKLVCRMFNLVPREDIPRFEVWKTQTPASKLIFIVPEENAARLGKYRMTPGAIIPAELMRGVTVVSIDQSST